MNTIFADDSNASTFLSPMPRPMPGFAHQEAARSDDPSAENDAIPSAPQHEPIRKRYRRARRRVYELLISPEVETRTERFLRAGIAALIVLNVLAVVLESVESIERACSGIFLAVELFSITVFTIEYLLRLWSVVEVPNYAHPIFGRLRYAVSFVALIDLVAVLPFYAHALITFDLRFVRGLRLLRLFRALKLGRYSRSLTLLAKVFRSKRDDILVSLFIIMLMLVLSSSLMFFLEHEEQPKAFPNIPAALWWGVATLTTVGYGDIYPVTAVGKICSAVIALLGIGLVALPSGLIVAGFLEEMQSGKASRTCPHCGKAL